MKTARVLFVEDSPIHIKLMLHHLRTAGYNVVKGQAVDLPGLVKALEAPWDLAIIDCIIPGYDGMAALKTIKAYHPWIECIVISGIVGEEMEATALAAGARAFVGKLSLSRMIDVAKEVLNDGRGSDNL